MKKKICVFIFWIFMGYSCYDNTDNYIPHIEVFSFFETKEQPGVKQPDTGAKVYLYNGLCSEDFIGYNYSADGVFVKDNSPKIEPREKYTIGEKGKVSFIPEYINEGATIVIESNYYKGKITSDCFSDIKNGVGFCKIFMPD